MNYQEIFGFGLMTGVFLSKYCSWYLIPWLRSYLGSRKEKNIAGTDYKNQKEDK